MYGYPSRQMPYNAFGIPPPPPRVARKVGKTIIWWPTDEGSLASRSIGKVNIDCRLRLSESKWGVLEGSQPAGILYVDLTFDQPAHCRLSSATVLISLEEYEEDDKKDEEQDKDEATLSRLRVCEFGPKLLTGEPTTLKRRTEYSFTPEVNAGVGGFGGLGVKRENSINYVSRWVLKGNTLAPADKKRKTPGIVYRTLKWELTENELAFQPEERSVVHTAFAFEHELKRFYIKVEISGKLSDAMDRFRHRVFPPRLKKNQGTLFTLVDLGAEDKARKQNLDNIARRLEEQMREKNLVSLATRHIDEPRATQQQETQTSGYATGGVDLADLAKATEKFAPVSRPGESQLKPDIYSTPTPSFASMATTLAPSQAGPASSEVPPASSPMPHAPENRKTQQEVKFEVPSEKQKTETEDPPEPEPEPQEESPEDLKLRKAEEKAIKVIAAELQFIEILIMLRAWAYATFLAMFIRNHEEKQHRTAGRKGSKAS
ncbi:hypothetical protein V8F20_009529 [Naviculisporaceae sp. PSN 640]